MSEQRKKLRRNARGMLFILSGPSGSGKTTLREKTLRDPLLKRYFAKSVSLTTRCKRLGEKHARDYFFVRKSEFLRLRKNKKLLEWTQYLGYYYATPKDFVEKEIGAGKSILLCLYARGAERLKKMYSCRAVTIFVRPPALEVLKARMLKRCRCTSHTELAGRLELARKELNAAQRFDYCVENKKLEVARRELKKIIRSKLTHTISGGGGCRMLP